MRRVGGAIRAPPCDPRCAWGAGLPVATHAQPRVDGLEAPVVATPATNKRRVFNLRVPSLGMHNGGAVYAHAHSHDQAVHSIIAWGRAMMIT